MAVRIASVVILLLVGKAACPRIQAVIGVGIMTLDCPNQIGDLGRIVAERVVTRVFLDGHRGLG
jgi:hypothetical protein